jgi:hypothetical protein
MLQCWMPTGQLHLHHHDEVLAVTEDFLDGEQVVMLQTADLLQRPDFLARGEFIRAVQELQGHAFAVLGLRFPDGSVFVLAAELHQAIAPQLLSEFQGRDGHDSPFPSSRSQIRANPGVPRRLWVC